MAEPTPQRVALTGGMAAGKSTVSRLLREAGFVVLDADAVVAELYRPGAAGAEAVRALLGDEVMTAEGGVDHRAVAARIFADPAVRRTVEQAVHPLVRRRFAELAAAADGIVIAEVPLLFEAGWQGDFDLVVTVEADPETQVKRAMERGLDEDQARARLAAQTSGATRRAGADVVIENVGTLAELGSQVERLIEQLERGEP